MAAVLPYLTANDGLRRLSLAQNEIDSESVGMVCLALVPKPRTAWLESVQYLDLGMNMIRDEGAKLVSCIAFHVPSARLCAAVDSTALRAGMLLAARAWK